MKMFFAFLVVLMAGFGELDAQNISEVHDSVAVTTGDFNEEFANGGGYSRVIPNEYKNIDGSPFISDEWFRAKLKLDNNRVYENVLVRLNVYDNKIHFKDIEGQERMMLSKVRELQITDEASPLNKSIFITGFAPNRDVFFRVLVDGPKVRLLEKFSARKTDIKVFNGEPKMQFDVDKEVYYYSVSVKNMYKGTKKIAEILDVFGNDTKVTEYASKNGLRGNKKEDAIKLVEHFNSY